MKIGKELTKTFRVILILLCFVSSISAQSIYTLQIATKIRVRMDNEINSKVSSINDTFTATVSSPVIIDGTEIVPIGSIIEGKIIKVSPAAAGKKDGNLEVKFESLQLPDDKPRPIDANLVNQNLVGKRSSAFTKISIIGGTIVGAVIGGIIGKGVGAGIGAGAGVGIGTAASYMKKGNEARIKANEEFEIILNREFTAPLKDY